MSLNIDISGGIFQCYPDQYSCESVCTFECWNVHTCEHKTASNYVCIPSPQILVISFIVWCALTVVAIVVVGHTCWKVMKYRLYGANKIHTGLIRSVSDLDMRVQNPSMIVALP